MGFRNWLTATAVACLIWVISSAFAPPAFAKIPIKLLDLHSQECPSEIGQGTVTVGGGSARQASCYLIKGKAKNTKKINVFDADVFGRIYDANGNNTFQNRGRVGSIDEVPPGISDFEIRVTVPANVKTPLKLKKFKASGFKHKIGR
ncbi:MAG: hypothetical protein F6K50_00385 [Moorea sp. SIO3I7]|uniref:hypothetical protein n=1 Tax=unclassified Moorena TaxID=2683338 RepID=UPI0013BF691D|nr:MULTISPECIES: hypothetical protein [unclassified Moorena]NEN94067.1 hypothetical protein [Moorena sp. SIO3I7]NEO06992.1 hypothetical protein [Moorena sp. SIO3I8]NEO18805.1 hypothetical protein [Moorena sp. SIO4A5]NEP21438.1 hypothetical protein [Moorena sp. SIO3I6]NEQ56797.1 hypothetical protein [Moorena sp. SIO4A1]